MFESLNVFRDSRRSHIPAATGRDARRGRQAAPQADVDLTRIEKSHLLSPESMVEHHPHAQRGNRSARTRDSRVPQRCSTLVGENEIGGKGKLTGVQAVAEG